MSDISRREISGIVLVGGRSRRMGREKSTLVVEGRTLVQRSVDALEAAGAREIVLVGSPDRALPPVSTAVPLVVARDAAEGEGPLQGILAGLEQASAPVAIVVGCDMPYLAPALLVVLARCAEAGARLVVPVHRSQPEGLCSAWRRDAIEVVRAHLERGDRAVMSVADDLEARLVQPEAYRAADPEGRSFVNVNTPADFAELAGSPHAIPAPPSGLAPPTG